MVLRQGGRMTQRIVVVYSELLALSIGGLWNGHSMSSATVSLSAFRIGDASLSLPRNVSHG